MEAVLLYFGKVTLCSGVTFLYYRLSLKDSTFHHYNRFYLLSAMVISLLLPLVRVEDFTIEVNSDLYRLIDQVQNFNNVKDTGNDYIFIGIVFSALGLVSLCLLARLTFGILKIGKFRKKFSRETFNGINFYRTDLTEAPFSFFRNLFWKNSIALDSDLGKQILKHEMVHIEQKHSVDKIFMEIMTSMFWFNPFFHLTKKEISLIHEYLADKKAVRHSDTKAFAQMLLASHFAGTALPAASPFLSSNLKKRLKMLQKPNTRFSYARRILALPVVFTLAFAYLVNAKNQEIRADNKVIEKAAGRINADHKNLVRKDTVAPRVKSDTVLPKIHQRPDDAKRIAELSKKIQNKAISLNSLKPETDEYYKNLEEIRAISGEIARIGISKDFLNSAMVIRMNGKDVHINDYFKSQEWEDQVKSLKDLNIEIPDMPEINLDIPDAPQSPDAPGVPRIKIYTLKRQKGMEQPSGQEEIRISPSRTKEPAAISRKRARLEKERARLEEKRARLEGERAKLEVERSMLDGDRKIVVLNNVVRKTPDGKVLKVNADQIRISLKDQSLAASGMKSTDGTAEHMKIYINGKESTNEQMKALDAKAIRSMNVDRQSGNGSKTGEIRIEMK